MGQPEAVVVFLNGACGDVTQVNNLAAGTPWEGGEAWGMWLGHAIAGEAIKVLSQPATVTDVPVGSAQTVLSLSPREIPEAVVREAEALLAARAADAPWDSPAVFAREVVLLQAMNRQEPAVPAEVQALRLGPTCLVASPAEYFCCFGLGIKARSKAPHTYVVELANGCVGYVPSAEQVLKEEGYEPKLARSSKLAPDAGERIAAASIELANRLCG
jgi:hypothetical protein